MFEVRKIQENVIASAIKAGSNEETAKEIVYGPDGQAKTEDNPAWVKSTMKRLKDQFDHATIQQIRRDCQCGHGMDEKLALVKALVAASSSMKEFGNLDKAKAAVRHR